MSDAIQVPAAPIARAKRGGGRTPLRVPYFVTRHRLMRATGLTKPQLGAALKAHPTFDAKSRRVGSNDVWLPQDAEAFLAALWLHARHSQEKRGDAGRRAIAANRARRERVSA